MTSSSSTIMPRSEASPAQVGAALNAPGMYQTRSFDVDSDDAFDDLIEIDPDLHELLQPAHDRSEIEKAHLGFSIQESLRDPSILQRFYSSNSNSSLPSLPRSPPLNPEAPIFRPKTPSPLLSPAQVSSDFFEDGICSFYDPSADLPPVSDSSSSDDGLATFSPDSNDPDNSIRYYRTLESLEFDLQRIHSLRPDDSDVLRIVEAYNEVDPSNRAQIQHFLRVYCRRKRFPDHLPFDVRAYSMRYSRFTAPELLHRLQSLDARDPRNVSIADAIIVECSFREPIVFFYDIGATYLNRRRLFESKVTVTKQKISASTKRVNNRALMRHIHILPHQKRTKAVHYLDSAPPVHRPPLMLSDWMSWTDVLKFGSVVADRTEVLSGDFDRIFARNKPLLSRIRAADSLSQFNVILQQKIISDGNFRKRVDDYMQNKARLVENYQMDSISSGDFVFNKPLPPPQYDSDEDVLPRDVDARPLPSPVEQSLPRSSMWTSVTPRRAEEAAAFVSTVVLVANSRSRVETLQILHLYLRSLNVADILETAVSLMVGWQEEQFQSGAAEHFAAEALSLLGVANIFAVSLMPVSAFQFFLDRFRSLAKMRDGDALLKNFWAAFKNLGHAVSDCYRLGSIAPLFDEGSRPDAILNKAECLVRYRNEIIGLTHQSKDERMDVLRKNGRIPREWTRTFLPQEYNDEVLNTIAQIDSILNVVSTEMRPVFISTRATLNTIACGSVNALSSNARRIQPLGVAIVGEAGSGKSNLVGLLVQYIGKRMGFSVDSGSTYYWQQGVNFQDGLNSNHWAIVCDDIDHNTKQAAPGIENHVDSIMKIIDNKPAPVESAAVHEKGNNYMRPAVVFYATNNENLRLVGFSPHFEAIYRRIPIRLRVRARPEFCSQGTLDSSKIDGAIDIHEIDIEVYDKTAEKYKLLKTSSTRDTLKYVFSRFDDNFKMQSQLIRGTASKECPDCFMPIGKLELACVECSRPVLQGPGVSKPIDDFTAAAASARSITSDIETRGLVHKVDRMCNQVDRAVTAPTRVATRVSSAVMSFGDVILNNPAPAAIIAAAISGICYLASQAQYQSRVNNETQLVPTNFVKVSDEKPTSSPFTSVTYTKEDLLSRCRANIGQISNNGAHLVFAMRVGLDVFLTVHHVVDHKEVDFGFAGVSRRITFTPDNYVQLAKRDLILFKVPGVAAGPTLRPMFWESQDLSISTFDQVILFSPFELRDSTSNKVTFERGQQRDYAGYTVLYGIETKMGDCGLPLIARVNGAYRIVGVHHLRYDGLAATFQTCRASAVVCSIADIRPAAAAIIGTFQCAGAIPSYFPGDFMQSPLRGDKSSELALAMANGAEIHNLGHVEGFRQFSSSKSGCRNSLYYADVEPWARERLGEPHPFQVPQLKGKMIDGQWHSGFQNVFKGYRNQEAYSGLYQPILDYVSAFSDCDMSGYLPLSRYEAIVGVPNSVIGPVNRSTSMGPPIGGKKSLHITPEGFVSPDLFAQMEEVETQVLSGVIPLAPSIMSYKDEPIKAKKAAKADVRVINNLPASFNLLCKQYLGPIKAMMRHNAITSESAVGINMLSDGGNFVRDKLMQVDPSLLNVVEGDFRKMDKMLNGSVAWGVVEVFKRFAILVGVNPDIVATIVWAQFNVIYCIQGDLFQVGASNPSGSDITVEINAIANAITQRAAWYDYHGIRITLDDYRCARRHPREYRQENSLITYGDDFLLSHSVRLDLPRLMSGFEAYGMNVTDGQKSEKPIYRSLWDCTFLKRQLIEVDGCVFCGLAEASLFRMLLINKPSKLSIKEQGAICCEEVMREVFLNPRLDYQLWRMRLIGLADKYSLWDSKYLKLSTYEDYLAIWRAGEFSTWAIPGEFDEIAQ